MYIYHEASRHHEAAVQLQGTLKGFYKDGAGAHKVPQGLIVQLECLWTGASERVTAHIFHDRRHIVGVSHAHSVN